MFIIRDGGGHLDNEQPDMVRKVANVLGREEKRTREEKKKKLRQILFFTLFSEFFYGILFLVLLAHVILPFFLGGVFFTGSCRPNGRSFEVSSFAQKGCNQCPSERDDRKPLGGDLHPHLVLAVGNGDGVHRVL